MYRFGVHGHMVQRACCDLRMGKAYKVSPESVDVVEYKETTDKYMGGSGETENVGEVMRFLDSLKGSVIEEVEKKPGVVVYRRVGSAGVVVESYKE